MKLIYLANARIPTEKAHGIQIAQMCRAFSQKGLIVELVVPKRINSIKDDLFHYYNIEPIFKITKLPCLDLVILGKLGFLIQTITFLISAKIFLFFKKYDILYTREPWSGLFFKNYFLEVHRLPIKFLSRPKGFIVLTSFIEKELIEKSVNPDRILVVPDGVDLEKFDIKISKKEARAKLNLPQDKKIILYAGSFYLYDWKGVDVLLEVAQKLNAENWLFVLVGGNAKEIKEIQNKYQLENILLVGHQPQNEIPIYLKAADILVLPNKKGFEASEKYTSPLKLFEYMASGRPMVASDLPSIREILNENNAVLVEPNNAKALAEGIKKVLSNPELADKISQKAYEDVKNYTWERRVSRILKWIDRQNRVL